jgi:phosphoribosylglycinamide formyltransferase-1
LPHQLLDYTRKDVSALQQALQEASPDVIITNIHKIIDEETLRLLPGRFINLHYSLLPAFKGLIGMQTIVKARELNVTVVGATCHEVDEQVDNGRCLAQFATSVDWSHDTLPEVYELVFRGACLVLLQGLLQHQQITVEHKQGVLSLMDRQSIFAPSVSFPVEALDEAFWQRLKKE